MNSEMKSKTFKILGALMAYPSWGIIEARDEIDLVLQKEGWLSDKRRIDIRSLIQEMSNKDLLDTQEEYVALFDRTPSLSLHLFEHVHGDSRDRGQAMVELDGLYREKGLHNSSEHTPDYLPMFLEYLSLLSVEIAQSNLEGAVDVIAAIGARLKKRKSSYACLFEALQDISACKPDLKKLRSALQADPGDLLTQEQMDKAWEEQFAFDQASEARNGGGCPKADEMLARMGMPASNNEEAKQ